MNRTYPPRALDAQAVVRTDSRFGIVTPLVTGLIVGATGSFVYALAFISVVTLLGSFSYVFVVGDIRCIVLPAGRSSTH